MPNPVIAYAKEHPIPVAIGAGVLFLGLVWLMSSGSSSAASSSAGGTSADAYFAAASAQAQAGDAVQIAQIEGQTAATQTLLNDQTAVANATTWAGAQTTQTLDTNTTDLSAVENTNATQVQLAPFAVQAGAVSGLSAAALTPPITNVKPGSSGFFGLFASGPTTTTTPSPVATTAVNQLDMYLNGFAPGH